MLPAKDRLTERNQKFFNHQIQAEQARKAECFYIEMRKNKRMQTFERVRYRINQTDQISYQLVNLDQDIIDEFPQIQNIQCVSSRYLFLLQQTLQNDFTNRESGLIQKVFNVLSNSWDKIRDQISQQFLQYEQDFMRVILTLTQTTEDQKVYSALDMIISLSTQSDFQCLIDIGIESQLQSLLHHKNIDIVSSSLWSISNFIGDERVQNSFSGINELKIVWNRVQNLTIIDNSLIDIISFFIQNALHYKKQTYNSEFIAIVFQIISQFVHIPSISIENIVQLLKISDKILRDQQNIDYTEQAKDCGIIAKALEYLHVPQAKQHSWRLISTFAYISDNNIEYITTKDMIKEAIQTIQQDQQNSRSEAASFISYVASSSESLIQLLIEADILAYISPLIYSDSFTIKGWFILTISNLTYYEDINILQYLHQNNVLIHLTAVLKNHTTTTIMQDALTGIYQYLKNWKNQIIQRNMSNDPIEEFYSTGCQEVVEKMNYSHKDNIAKCASLIIKEFCEDVQEQEINTAVPSRFNFS